MKAFFKADTSWWPCPPFIPPQPPCPPPQPSADVQLDPLPPSFPPPMLMPSMPPLPTADCLTPTCERSIAAPFKWISRSTKSMEMENLCSINIPDTPIPAAHGCPHSLEASTSHTMRCSVGTEDSRRSAVLPMSTWKRHSEKSARCETWTHTAVWIVAALTALAVVAGPLLFDKPCNIDAWEDHAYYRSRASPRDFILGHLNQLRDGVPYIGEHFVVSIISFCLLTRYWRSSNRTSKTFRWLKRYVFAMVVMSVSHALMPWLILACPSKGLDLLYGVLNGVYYLSYIFAQTYMGQMSVVRLELMRQASAAARGAKLARLWQAMAVVIMVAFPLFTAGLLPTWVVLVICLATFLVYGAFQCCVFVGFIQGMQMAMREARLAKTTFRQVKSIRFITCSLVVATVTTLGWIIFTGTPPGYPSWIFWIKTFVVALDLVSDAALVLACAGMLGLPMDQEQDLQVAGELVEAARQRQVLQTLTDAARAATGPSVTLAALFEGREPEELLRAAVARFRCISWDTLRDHAYLITGGGSLDGELVAEDLYKLSEPCYLSECDAFLSHSWHDSGDKKWKALTEWCTTFSEVHGRAPRLWFDKVCINQTDIQNDLQCLPIFLAGCNTLLVTCGRTYTRRLWCCVELFVYMKMSEGCDHDIQVSLLGESQDEEQDLVEAWRKFDLQKCECFQENDKSRILDCIAKDSGAHVFNMYIRNLAALLFPTRFACRRTQERADNVNSSFLRL
eukprot:TRINITY_DN19551_c0_g1_i1.p1 TRINITY_DN19551_c0_g1~~TRINITY_DN19551_c0_g1_i1.p1  ORF type:complete len:735 (+),score=45.49 TRINITY_DN19551_c0_g1_i1:201-2405(+)